MSDWYAQPNAGVRFEWGATGAAQLVEGTAALVVVDVLSFTTSVSVAVERGIAVYPHPWKDDSAVRLGERVDAAVASTTTRRPRPEQPWTLAPSVLRAAPFVQRLVLPSPNGSTISAAAPPDVVVAAACLRNVAAVGAWLTGQGYGGPDRPVAVIAAGERWKTDGGLRPSVEDALGAGAVLASLASHDVGPLSPEAELCRRAYDATEDVAAAVVACGSGRELIEQGSAEDVEIAVELDATQAVPILSDGAFTDRRGG